MRDVLAVVLAAARSSLAQATREPRPPLPAVDSGNPLMVLASALVGAVLYLLSLIQAAVTFVTITIPTYFVRMVHYSLTISLGFPHFVALFVVVAGTIFFLIRYRYLTRYTQLKEPALPQPSPPTLTNSLPLLADSVLEDPSRRPTNPLHSYLDDFLSAIRIFGYLEKPVFHELSRHLQTRRLAAGETMEVGGGEFWCVVEGRVQVFAPTSDGAASPDPFDNSSFNGYSLINEVSTGGTLSSLFSILSLFTEDIKLPWVPEDNISDDFSKEEAPSRRLSRANSDVSELNSKMMGLSNASNETSPTTASSPQAMLVETPDELATRGRSSSLSTADGTAREPSWPPNTSRQPTISIGDIKNKILSPGGSMSQPNTAASSPNLPPSQRPLLRPSYAGGEAPSGRDTPHSHRAGTPFGATATKGTIARATVDSTLAVIPAEAFRKLTRKFPKAAGSIVQVVLERFSRVTFMTAHKFLGLTKEILRSEASLNSLVSYPLPRIFYTGGGLQALRNKFQPDAKRKHSGQEPRDYFSYESPSPTVKAPSLAGMTPMKSNTPAMKSTRLPSERMYDAEDSGEPESSPTSVRHPSNLIRRTSQARREMAVGDLAVGSEPDVGETFYRPVKTPGLPRMESWRGRMPTSASNASMDNGGARMDSIDSDVEDENLLREALVTCMAQSIGLLQVTEPDSRGYMSTTQSTSAHGSPMFHPNGRPHSQGRPPFGNVLDMINASSHESRNVSGLLRESLLNQYGEDDDASSISASVPGSSFVGSHTHDVNAKIKRDLGNQIEVLFFKKGSTLVKQGEQSSGLYYVIDGFLDVSIPVSGPGADAWTAAAAISRQSEGRPFGAGMGHDHPTSARPPADAQVTEDEQLFTVKPGGLAGYLASLCGTESYVNITAKTDCFVGFLPPNALERIMERRPIVLLTLAKRLLSLLSPLVLHIDAGLDWIQLGAGEILFEKGERSSDFYIIINGRLRSVVKKADSESVDVIREYGQNDSIGELDVMTAAPRSDTVQAIRETELVRIPAALFDAISTRHPATTVQFMRLIAGEVRKHVSEQRAHYHPSNTANELRADMNLKTVCILGNTRNVPVAQVASKLKTSLEEMGAPASYLDQATVMRHLGRHAFTRIGALKIAGWLADQEQQHRIVLYVADTPPSSQWTMTCIRQADLVLILGMGDDPSLGEYEKLLLAMKSFARKELVLLHEERSVPSGSTRLWLKNRPWLQAHYHVELPGVTTVKTSKVHDPAAVSAFKHLRERVETRIKKYRTFQPLNRPRRPPHTNDFARIARRLCGKQVGLVLGGGGARGISHIGMLQALEEYGIPVDAVSGCSIGSFVGGLYSRSTDILETAGRTKQFAGRMGSMLRILSDVTYPYVAYTTGHEFNRGIYKAFYNTHIEDFWIPFYCNSTNITHSRMEVHRSGYAWRFVRASMTLAGFLPPLTDSGNLLVDGGYMDNTPIGPLRSSGIKDIIVVDVGSIDDRSARNYGDSVSGWWLFINRFNPFYQNPVPSMTEISSRLTYVSSVKTLEDVKTDPSCRYMAMPVQHFETIGGFKQFNEVYKVGLDAAREQLRAWSAEGRLPHGLVEGHRPQIGPRRGTRIRRMSI